MLALAAAAARYRIKGTSIYVKPHMRAAASQGVAYDGASLSPRIAPLSHSGGGPNTVNNQSLNIVRGRSRNMARNNGLADAGLGILTDHLIGTGIRPQFNTKSPDLNKGLKKLWDRWTDEA